MFLVIAANGKQYGPLSTEQVKEWVEKGWLNSKNKIKAEEESDWKTIGDISAFNQVVAAPPSKKKNSKTSSVAKEIIKEIRAAKAQEAKAIKAEKTVEPSAPVPTEEETPSFEQKEEVMPEDDATSSKIILAVGGWSILAVASIFFGVASIFWMGILSIIAVIFGSIGYRSIKKNPEWKGRSLAITGLALGCVTLVIAALNLFTITIPSLRDGEENLRRIQMIQDSIDKFPPTSQEYQCWNASGLKISYVDGVILNPSETQRIIDAISTLDAFKSANVPNRELTPDHLILMRIGHEPNSYIWRVVCYRRNAKGYGTDRKGRSMKPEAFAELQRP